MRPGTSIVEAEAGINAGPGGACGCRWMCSLADSHRRYIPAISADIGACRNGTPKSLEITKILMFVYLQKDAKQCCDAKKLDCTHCADQP